MAVITPQEAEKLSPLFKGKAGRVLYHIATRVTGIERVNRMHTRVEDTGVTGPGFAAGILNDPDVQIDYAIGHAERLETLPEGGFITISNHLYGHLDGIILVDMLGHIRPRMKVMVNELLMWMKGINTSFIAVNPTGSERTSATARSVSGVREALGQLRDGEPLSLFPSGAVSDCIPKEHWTIRDREWQDAAIRLIQKAKVPVVPIRFFDRNSDFYYALGLVDYRIRLVRLFHEVFNKKGTHPRLGIGETIPAEEIARYTDLQELKAFLRGSIYQMPEPEQYTLHSAL